MTRLRPAVPGGALLLALRDPLALVSRMTALQDDVAWARLGPRKLYLLCDPALIRELLAHSGDALRKERALRLARIILGDGLLTSEGERHREQRRRLRPVFERQRIAGYGAAVIEQAQAVVGRWQDGDVIDPYWHMRWLTVEATALALFGRPLVDGVPRLMEAVDVASRGFDRHRNPLAWLLNRLPVPGTLRLRRARQTIRDAATDLIDGEGAGPLAEILRGYPDRRQALDEAVTILLAGHETTAVALTWCCHLLAGHPEVEERLQAEVDAVYAAGPLDPGDLSRLPYTRAVVAESMRLYPPVWAISREVVTPLRIGPYVLPRGAVVMVSPYGLHRDPRHWPDPERFDPDRFAETGIQPFTYVPFSGGVRGCVGEGLAWTECVLGMAVLTRRWRLESEPGSPVTARPGISLRPSLRIRVRRRTTAHTPVG